MGYGRGLKVIGSDGEGRNKRGLAAPGFHDPSGGADQPRPTVVAVNGNVLTRFYCPESGIVKMLGDKVGVAEPAVIAHVEKELGAMTDPVRRLGRQRRLVADEDAGIPVRGGQGKPLFSRPDCVSVSREKRDGQAVPGSFGQEERNLFIITARYGSAGQQAIHGIIYFTRYAFSVHPYQ